MPAIHWFRRDLRVADNPALDAAGPDAVAVFVRDPRFDVGEVRATYLDGALAELASARTLQIHAGDPAVVLGELAERLGAREVFCTADTTPFARKRDATVEDALAQRGVTLRQIDTPYAVPPGSCTHSPAAVSGCSPRSTRRGSPAGGAVRPRPRRPIRP